jgi:hypothetical protein
LEFTTNLAEKVNTDATQDAYVYALVEAAAIKLQLGQGDAVRKDLDAATKILDTFDSIDNVIHAAFYRINADYYSVLLTFSQYSQIEQDGLYKLLPQCTSLSRLSPGTIPPHRRRSSHPCI